MQQDSAGKRGLRQRLLRTPMILAYVLCAYLIVNFIIKVPADPWAESWRLINFAAFAYLLYRIVRKPLLQAIDSKIKELDELFKHSESALAKVQKDHEKAVKLLGGVDQDGAKIIEKARNQGEAEKEDLIADGARRARSIVEQAKVTLEGMERAMYQKVHEEMVRRCIARARERLDQRLTPEAHLALIRSRIPKVRRVA
ncbi:MAG: ATP synthase F0 subunit B [Candidatus Coatesbacteria bacterium]|nr:ATP synthase F0 subunit B [Candidatus Coatesbacteria bacterium]